MLIGQGDNMILIFEDDGVFLRSMSITIPMDPGAGEDGELAKYDMKEKRHGLSNNLTWGHTWGRSIPHTHLLQPQSQQRHFWRDY